MKIRKKMLLFIALAALLLMVACSNEKAESEDVEVDEEALENLNESGMPIVKEPIKLDFFTGKPPITADNYDEVLVWETYQEMSNIDIEWELIQKAGLSEKRNLSLASGNLPDVFYSSSMPNSDLLKYGKQGIFIPLNDLIEKHMPNLSKIFEENPEIKKGMTFPDGNMYALPTIYEPGFTAILVGSKLWIREDWLKELDMDMPQTTDEFYEYLKAVKETDLNGNGKKDEIPFGSDSVSHLRQWLTGSFGIQTRGRSHNYIDIDPETNDLRFFPIADGYKEMLQFMNKLYSEKLIQKNIFSIDKAQHHAQGAEGLLGSTTLPNVEGIFGEEIGKKYVGMPALEGPNGDHIFTKIGSPLINMGGFVVTKENKYPAASLKWMDYFYGDEGATLYFMGVEGDTYEKKEDGSLEYADKIMNSPDGLTFEQELKKYITWIGGGYPGIVKKGIFQGAATRPSGLAAAETVEPDMIEEVWPKFTYTADESRELTALAADIEKYVVEMQDKFISGNVSFTEWDKYVETIENMGLENYMKIKEAAYERYQNN